MDKRLSLKKPQIKATKGLTISNKTDITELNIRFHYESVALVDNHNHLGVTFASDGNWTVHIENIATSPLKQRNALRKLNFTLSKKASWNSARIWIVGVVLVLRTVHRKIRKKQLEAARIATSLTKFATKNSSYVETVLFTH